MADTRGCWSLSEAWAEKSAAEWVPVPNVWVVPAISRVNTGYIGGGQPAANIDKLNFSNDTKTGLGSILPGSPRKSGSVGGNTHGYFGGRHPGYENFINKIVYATDVGSRIPATLSAGRGYLAGCNSETNGYFVGGAGSFNSYRSIVDRITHATDTCSRIPSADLPSANTKQSLMATTASPGAAYIQGGVSPATTAVSKLTFSTEASAQVPGAAMITARGYATTTSNGTNTYIYGGGTDNSGSVQTTDIDKTVFASDTTSNIPANMPNSYNVRAAATGASTFGVIAGGYHPGPSNTNSAFKFTYGSESVATAPGYNLSSNKKEAAGNSARNGFTGTTYDGDIARWFDDASQTNNNAYTGGGAGPSSGNARNAITKFDFSTDTAEDISPSSTLSSARYTLGAVSSPSAGYWMGGSNGFGKFSRVDKLTYATDSVAYTPGANLSSARYGSYCTGNTTKGYSGGTNTSGDGVGSVMDRLTYATDTTTRLPGSNLTTNRRRCGVAGSLTVGYWMGSAFERSSTDKMTYATEAVAVVPSAQLPTARGAMGACASATDVYTAGGRQSPGDAKTSQILKLNLSSEAISIDASLSGVRYGVSGTGNSTKGYFIGGTAGSAYPGGAKTHVEKFIYSTSTLSTFNQPNVSWESGSMARRENSLPFQEPPPATPTASTTTLRSIGSVPNTGYFGGGDPGNNNSVKRFNFSNETTSTIPATLSQSRELTGGTSSITYGYFSGGRSPYYSITDRVTYSNDTVGRIPGANTITNIADCLGSGVRSYGILGGGMSPTRRNYAQKLSFADETISNDGSLPEARQAGAVVTEPETAGYFMAGTTPAGSDRSSVDKYTFSTSTGSAYPANTLLAKGYQTGMGSLTAGYVTGGPVGGGAGYSDVKKLTYSTSTWSTLSDTMSAGKYLGGGLNNTLFGVFCGGLPSNQRSEKVTFATETVARIPGANWADNWYRINGAGAQMNSAYATNPNVI